MPNALPLLPTAPLLEALARFSAPGPGVTRFTYDTHWCEAHAWLRARAESLGLRVHVDGAGDLYFAPPHVQPGERVLLVGSHLDSVQQGGAYDGAYGTIAGLVLAAAHREARGMPVVGFVTCEEEQSRFDSHMMGARAMLGQITHAELDCVRDHAGVTWRAALAEARARGCAGELHADAPVQPLFAPAAQLELHIEQGPVLEDAGVAIGVVESIAGYVRMRATLTGAPRHSGTTPSAARRDALAAAAEIVLACETLARESGEPARVTAGRLQVKPALYNVVPGEVELGLEVRHGEAAALATLERTLLERAAAIAARRGIGWVCERVAQQAPTRLSGVLADAALACCGELALSAQRMTSGAAHDTMEFARVGIPALMLFVPSRDGISHAPEEYSSPEQLDAGVRVASALLARLAAGGAA